MSQKIRFQTGDVLICKSADYPLIHHFGIVVVEDSTACVYHCTPANNVKCDTLVDFLTRYTFQEYRRTNVPKEILYRKYKEVRHRGYDVNEFNCIHFVNHLTDKRTVQ